MNLTAKQMAILKVVVAGNGGERRDFVPVDLDQILERLDYRTTKEALQFSIRALIRHRLIMKRGTEKRRDRRHVLIAPTATGRRVVLMPEDPSCAEKLPLPSPSSEPDFIQKPVDFLSSDGEPLFRPEVVEIVEEIEDLCRS